MLKSRNGAPFVEEKTALIFLAAYRGFILVLAVSLSVSTYTGLLRFPWLILTGITIIYALFKVIRPSSRYDSKALTRLDFSIDCALAFSLLPVTGGLHSPFLLYSLSPVLTSALLFPRKLSLLVAAMPGIAAVIGQAIVGRTTGSPLLPPAGLSVSLLITYVVASFLLALLPYFMNMNVTHDIRVQAIIEERKRLSRDIHDRVSQTLGVVRWRMQLLSKKVTAGNISQAINDIAEIDRMMAEAQQETKAVIEQLRSAADENQGFATKLARYATDFAHSYGVRCEIHIEDGEVKLSALTELELLCVAQEALNNVRKHAAATEVQVGFVSNKDGSAELTIRDDGRGFEPDAVHQGYGLAVMDERAKSVGAELQVNSSPGHGTEVKVKMVNCQKGTGAL